MVKTRRWIEHELLCDSGLRREFGHQIELHVGSLSSGAYGGRSISREIEACETRYGPLSRMVSELLAAKRGLWFYAGWIDQAVLHVGKVEVGDARLFGSMLRQIDKDQVDQGGDMMIGFAPNEEDWLFVVEVSPQDDQFVIAVKTNAEEQIESVRAALGS